MIQTREIKQEEQYYVSDWSGKEVPVEKISSPSGNKTIVTTLSYVDNDYHLCPKELEEVQTFIKEKLKEKNDSTTF